MEEKNPLSEDAVPTSANDNPKSFIGCKIIQARPMSHFSFLKRKEKEIPEHENQEGYLVTYPDSYESWSPKNVFDNAYREILQSEKDLIV